MMIEDSNLTTLRFSPINFLHLAYFSTLFALPLMAIQIHAVAQLPPVQYPAENPHSEEKRVLGKILFWEEQLSSNDTVACGTCHISSSAGSDPRLGLHPGFDGVFATADDIVGSPGVVRMDTNRNPIADPVFGFGPQVTGRAAQSYFVSMFSRENFWDGRATPSFIDPEDGITQLIADFGGLESQAVGPIVSTVEMAHEGRSWDDVKGKLGQVIPLLMASEIPSDMQAALDESPTYPELFVKAFGDSGIDAGRIAFAIATYERTQLPDQTPWDRYEAGDLTAMTPAQITGWEILRDRTVCLNCHPPPLFTDNRFHNIGLRPSLEDEGRFAVTGNAGDHGRFKTPTLRNIGLKSSMMHVGWIVDVQDAIDFYNAGTQITDHVQFTEDQSGMPTNTPGFFADYSTLDMDPRMQPDIIDFMVNGLTDPRVANEEFPFDRPTLLSEMPESQMVYANGGFKGMENGSEAMPYNTLEEALVHVANSGSVIISPGTLGGPIRIEQPVTLECPTGSVTLGLE